MIYNLKNFKLKSTLIVFSLAALLGVFVWQATQNSAFVADEKTVRVVLTDVVKTNKVESVSQLKKAIKFENVSFEYDTSLFADVKGEIVEASPLENPTDKPDNVYPRGINFIFKKHSTSGQPTGEAYYSGVEIEVYKIEDFKKSYSFYGIDSQADFDKLREITIKKNKIYPSDSSRQLPYLPFIDAHQAFLSKCKIINFQSGNGLLYLTQWQQDANVINNDSLALIFQGISNDNQSFVFMRFDVSAQDLPPSNGAKYPEKYKKLNDVSNHLSENYQQLYRKYALETALKLDKTPSADFTPNLDKVEELIRSLKIE